MEALLADLVVAVHLAAVAFVVLMPVAVLFGAWRGQAWVRRLWPRIVHLVVVGYIVFNAIRGELCFLTYWEYDLRSAAGQTDPEDVSFIGRLLHDILFLDVEQEVLDRWYIGFGALVLLVTLAVPPRWRRGAREGGGETT